MIMITYNILFFIIGLFAGLLLSVVLMRFKAWDLEEENIKLKNYIKHLNNK